MHRSESVGSYALLWGVQAPTSAMEDTMTEAERIQEAILTEKMRQRIDTAFAHQILILREKGWKV